MAQTTGRRSKGRAREESVLQAATEAIAELGLANVRMVDVAERAGIGPGHVTYYFPSKADLLMRAIRWSEEGLRDSIDDEISRITDPWERLRKLFELAASQGPGDPAWVLWFEVWAKAGTDRALADGADEFETWWRTALSDAIRYGCDRGSFATEGLDEVVLAISAMIDGLSIQLTLGAPGITRGRMLELCMSAARRYLDPERVVS